MLRSDAYYKGLAERWVKESGVGDPPVAIERVAERFGVPVLSVRLPAWSKGALVYEDGMPIVVLNAGSDEQVRRATLAHLLAHIIIVLDDETACYPRDALPYHREAEIVAAELLLPSYLVAQQASMWFNDYRYLARLFAVDEAAMADRMRDLGLLRATGTGWDL